MTVAPQGVQNPAYRPTPPLFPSTPRHPVRKDVRGGRVGFWDERVVQKNARPECDRVGSCQVPLNKKTTAIKHLGEVPRNRWKYGHTVAFLIDSQAKIP
jgi:hypothetical protein